MRILSNYQTFSNINNLKNINITSPQNNKIEKKDYEITSVYYPVFTGAITKNMPTKLERFEGCLLGGAIGDAFGAPIEFMKLSKIKKLYGEEGLTVLSPDKSGKIKFTDDTELTLFSVDGLIKSARIKKENSSPNINIMFDSYRDWFRVCAKSQKLQNGWISSLDEIRSYNGSGKTCMEVLSNNKPGTIEKIINNSKGSGAVMRSAPFGLKYHNNPYKAYEYAKKCAIMTHGNPSGYLPAAVYAAIIANIIKGENLEEAILRSIGYLNTEKSSENIKQLLEKAIALSRTDIKPEKAVQQIGLGWVGDEALAIAIYCSLKTPNDFKKVIINATNHNGDSDTVGSIAGGIVGTYIGCQNIPSEFKSKLDTEKILINAARDLFLPIKSIKHIDKRYPIKRNIAYVY